MLNYLKIVGFGIAIMVAIIAVFCLVGFVLKKRQRGTAPKVSRADTKRELTSDERYSAFLAESKCDDITNLFVDPPQNDQNKISM